MSTDVQPITVLQLSDLHLFAEPEQELLGLNTDQSLERVLRRVRSLSPQPDLILLTGDLAQDESTLAYRALKNKFAEFSVPIYAIPGNHDDPDLIQSILSDPPFSLDRSFTQGGWHFILLDSSIPGKVQGRLSADTLTLLQATLADITLPTIIALHHPAYSVQSQWLDDIGLENQEEFWAAVEPFSHVKVVLCGHVHQDTPYHRNGIDYLSVPSTCVQFAPHRATFAVDDVEPGFRVLQLWPNGHYESWIERVPVKQQVNLTAQGY